MGGPLPLMHIYIYTPRRQPGEHTGLTRLRRRLSCLLLLLLLRLLLLAAVQGAAWRETEALRLSTSRCAVRTAGRRRLRGHWGHQDRERIELRSWVARGKDGPWTRRALLGVCFFPYRYCTVCIILKTLSCEPPATRHHCKHASHPIQLDFAAFWSEGETPT